MNTQLRVTFSHKINSDYIFDGLWEGKAFKALFIHTDIDYGWAPLSYLPEFSKEDCGVYEYDSEHYEDIQDALNELEIGPVVSIKSETR